MPNVVARSSDVELHEASITAVAQRMRATSRCLLCSLSKHAVFPAIFDVFHRSAAHERARTSAQMIRAACDDAGVEGQRHSASDPAHDCCGARAQRFNERASRTFSALFRAASNFSS
jgi:hypothetical protein